jgi:hypothetical protein
VVVAVKLLLLKLQTPNQMVVLVVVLREHLAEHHLRVVVVETMVTLVVLTVATPVVAVAAVVQDKQDKLLLIMLAVLVVMVFKFHQHLEIQHLQPH